MFGAPGLGFTEILVLGILALLVVGPKDLPLMLRKLGRWTARLRGMAAEFRSGFDELARQAELDELRKEVNALRHEAGAIADGVRRPLETLTRPTPLTPLPPPVRGAPIQEAQDIRDQAAPDDEQPLNDGADDAPAPPADHPGAPERPLGSAPIAPPEPAR